MSAHCDSVDHPCGGGNDAAVCWHCASIMANEDGARRDEMIAQLTAERDAARAELRQMHRRAQASEGAEARLARQRETHAREIADIRANHRGRVGRIVAMIRGYREQLWVAGVSQAIDGLEDKPHHREGRVGILIDRLVKERDHWRAKWEALEIKRAVCCDKHETALREIRRRHLSEDHMPADEWVMDIVREALSE